MTPSTTTGITGPASGDVLIAREVEGETYTLSIMPGPAQVRCPTFEVAKSTARAWALQRRVAVWFTEDEHIFTPVSLAGEPATTHGVDNPRATS